MNYMEAAFAPAERVYKRTIIHDTFGRLAPKANETYVGWILFTHACCGDITVIDYDFKTEAGEELVGSPWSWEDINEYVGEKVCPARATGRELPSGSIFLFKGTYRRTEDRPKSKDSETMIEGKGTFKGRIKEIKVKH